MNKAVKLFREAPIFIKETIINGCGRSTSVVALKFLYTLHYDINSNIISFYFLMNTQANDNSISLNQILMGNGLVDKKYSDSMAVSLVSQDILMP